MDGINLDKRGRFNHRHHHDDDDGPDIINMDDMAFCGDQQKVCDISLSVHLIICSDTGFL